VIFTQVTLLGTEVMLATALPTEPSSAGVNTWQPAASANGAKARNESRFMSYTSKGLRPESTRRAASNAQ
jgi:hypothetical protein